MTKKVVTWLAIAFVIFWLLSAPSEMADTVDGLIAGLRDAAQSLQTFLTSLGD